MSDQRSVDKRLDISYHAPDCGLRVGSECDCGWQRDGAPAPIEWDRLVELVNRWRQKAGEPTDVHVPSRSDGKHEALVECALDLAQLLGIDDDAADPESATAHTDQRPPNRHQTAAKRVDLQRSETLRNMAFVTVNAYVGFAFRHGLVIPEEWQRELWDAVTSYGELVLKTTE